MDADRFDTLSRTLTTSGSHRATLRALSAAISRRRLAGVVSGSGLGTALGLISRPGPVSAGCGKPCGPCKRCKRGRCRSKPNDTPCKGDGRCLKGRCNPRPSCVPASQGCTSGNAGACCSGVCGFGQDPRCVRGETDATCLTGSDCISGQCIGYRCQSQVDCATAPANTICAMDRACQFGQCVECWNWQDDGCCDVARTAISCIRNAICQAGQCLSCPAAQQCEGRCLSSACSNHCYKSCGPTSPCCSELTCQHMPEQDNFDMHRCAPA